MAPPAKKAPAKKASKLAANPPVSVARATPQSVTTVFTDRRIALLVTFLALVVGALAASTAIGLAQRQTDSDVLGIIKDSVDPDGRRFQEGQARTEAAVSTINEISILGAYCAQQTPKDLAAIQGCVRAEYARMHPTTTTVPR